MVLLARVVDRSNKLVINTMSESNKKAQLSLTNPRDDCEKFARFT